jgi:hypothetical protein
MRGAPSLTTMLAHGPTDGYLPHLTAISCSRAKTALAASVTAISACAHPLPSGMKRIPSSKSVCSASQATKVFLLFCDDLTFQGNHGEDVKELYFYLVPPTSTFLTIGFNAHPFLHEISLQISSMRIPLYEPYTRERPTQPRSP